MTIRNQIIKTALLNFVPITFTCILIFVPLVIISLPVIGVFIIDDATTIQEIASVYLLYFSIALGISGLVIFPINLLLGYFAKKSKYPRWLLSLVFLLIINALFFLSLINTIESKIQFYGYFLTFPYLSILFIIYSVTYSIVEYFTSLIFKILKKF